MCRHWVGIAICVCGISIGFVNDFLYIKDPTVANSPILGDILTLVASFLYATENVLQEYLIKKPEDVFNYLGWLGLFGSILCYLYALIFDEYS